MRVNACGAAKSWMLSTAHSKILYRCYVVGVAVCGWFRFWPTMPVAADAGSYPVCFSAWSAQIWLRRNKQATIYCLCSVAGRLIGYLWLAVQIPSCLRRLRYVPVWRATDRSHSCPSSWCSCHSTERGIDELVRWITICWSAGGMFWRWDASIKVSAQCCAAIMITP